MNVELVQLISRLDGVHELLAVYDIRVHYGEKGENNWIDVTHPMVEHISELASKVIFTERGHLNYLAIRGLRDAGYTVFPVEVDKDYGWFTAAIDIPGIAVLAVYNSSLDNRWKKTTQSRGGSYNV
jgi:hypothetical protein